MCPSPSPADDRSRPAPKPPMASAWADEAGLIEALRAGDEAAFREIVVRYHTYMIRLARCYVKDQPSAEEVVQETWLGALKGLDRFEARSSLRTWLFRILTNRAKTRATRDARLIPFSAMVDREAGADEASMEAALFQGGDGVEPGHWRDLIPARWAPDRAIESEEIAEMIKAAIDRLPEAQRAVITLRDLNDLDPEEVCNTLAISETNQRVLLHRARTKVRRAIGKHIHD